jgi:hypothetical protein
MKLIVLMMVLMGLSVVVPAIYGIVSAPRKFRTRTRALSDYVTRKGYVLLNPSVTTLAVGSMTDLAKFASAGGGLVSAMAGITDIEPFNNGTDKNALAFICTLGGKQVTIFEFGVQAPINANTPGPHYRVAKIRSAGLPRFALGRHSAVEKIEQLHDFLAKIPSTTLDRGTFPGFFQHYWMKGLDATAVYAFLTPTKLAYLEQTNLAGVLAANADYLVYYESHLGEPLRPEEYDPFIAEVSALIAHLF